MTQKAGSKAYLLLVFLTLLNVVNFIDRQLIPTLAPKLIDELGLSKAQIGLLYGFVFVVFYTLIGLFLGTVADRYHRPRLIAGGLTIWSALTAASGAAKTFVQLAAARVFVGVGEATLTPAALSMLSDVFPENKRGFASGVYYAGVPLGVGAGFVISGWLAPDYGWRTCFYVLGVAGLFLVPVLLFLKNPARGGAEKTAAPAPEAEQTNWFEIAVTLYRALKSTPALGLAILYGTLINYSTSSAIHVLTWLVEERGMEYQQAAYLSGRIYAVAGLMGVVLGGYVSDWCHARRPGGRLWFLIIKGFIFLPFIYGFYTLPPAGPLFFFCWFMSSLQSTTWYGPDLRHCAGPGAGEDPGNDRRVLDPFAEPVRHGAGAMDHRHHRRQLNHLAGAGDLDRRGLPRSHPRLDRRAPIRKRPKRGDHNLTPPGAQSRTLRGEPYSRLLLRHKRSVGYTLPRHALALRYPPVAHFRVSHGGAGPR